MPPTPWYRLLCPATGDRPELRFVRELHVDSNFADLDEQPRADVQAALRRWLLRVGRYRTRAACNLVFDHEATAISDHALRSLVRRDRRRAERAFAAMKGELHARHEVTAPQTHGLEPHIELELINRRTRRGRSFPPKSWLLDEDD